MTKPECNYLKKEEVGNQSGWRWICQDRNISSCSGMVHKNDQDSCAAKIVISSLDLSETARFIRNLSDLEQIFFHMGSVEEEYDGWMTSRRELCYTLTLGHKSQSVT